MTTWPTPVPSVSTVKASPLLPALMWNSIRELPLSGSSASVALMVTTVCPIGVSSVRVRLSYCTQMHSHTAMWRKSSKQHDTWKQGDKFKYSRCSSQTKAARCWCQWPWWPLYTLCCGLWDRECKCCSLEWKLTHLCRTFRCCYIIHHICVLPGSLTLTLRWKMCCSFRCRERRAWIVPELASMEKMGVVVGCWDMMVYVNTEFIVPSWSASWANSFPTRLPETTWDKTSE